MIITANPQPSNAKRFPHVYKWKPENHAGDKQVPLRVDQIGGPFSLIDDTPMTIAGVPGLTFTVHKGYVWISGELRSDQVRAGESYLQMTQRVTTLVAHKSAEIQVASSMTA